MIVFTLEEADAQKVLNAVATQPFRDVSALMQTLMTQAQAQLSAQAQEAQAGQQGLMGVPPMGAWDRP